MRGDSNAIKIRHTAGAKEHLTEAHKLMNISHKLSDELGGVFNQWAKVRITDKEVKHLIQVAIAPNKETLDNLHSGRHDELSTVYTNMVDKVYEYAMSAPSQPQERCSVPTMPSQATSKTSATIRTERPNLNPLWTE